MSNKPARSYDPKACGARCDECPLQKDRAGGPVPPELKQSSVIVVGEAPAKNEVLRRAPFVGPSGGELEDALNEHGYSRADVSLTNVIACQLPKSAHKTTSDFASYLQNVKKKGLLSPVEACAGRLAYDLQGYPNVIAAGEAAAKAIFNHPKGILSIRGTPFELDGGRKGVPVLHPAHVLRQARWRWVFRLDIGRAFRYFNDELQWEPYDYLVYPSPDQLEEWLEEASKGRFIAYDVETDSKYPLRAALRCIGFSTENSAVTVPFLSVNGRNRYYSLSDEARIVQIIRRYSECGVTWVGHNEGWYDRITMENLFGIRFLPHFDTILGHRAAWPYLPHDLGTVGTTLSDVTAWKASEAGHKISKTDIKDLSKEMGSLALSRFTWDRLWNDCAEREFYGGSDTTAEPVDGQQAPVGAVVPLHDSLVSAEARGAEISKEIVARDAILYKYNSKDNIVVARVVDRIIDEAERRNQFGPLTKYPEITKLELMDHCQDMCVGLHRQGVYIDQQVRGRAEQWLRAWSAHLLQDLQQRVAPWWDYKVRDEDGDVAFNPNSTLHKKYLLYKKWDLVPKEFTDTGDPSCNDKAIRAHIMEDSLPEEVEDVLYAMRKYIKVTSKWLGTYVAPFAVQPFKHAKPTRNNPSGLIPLPSALYPDGRVRAQWNAHGTPVWRYSASDPGLQTIPGDIKPMYTAAPGHILVGADADQIHLRIIANLWDVAYYQECFAIKGDPHATGAFGIFGEMLKSAKGFPKGHWVGPVFVPTGVTPEELKWSGKAKELRQLAKTFIYAFAYGADVSTIYKVLIKAEDNKGRLAFKKIGDDGRKLMTEDKVDAMRESLLRRMPEFERGWNLEMELAQANGLATGEHPWLADPIAGVRIDFPGGVTDPEEQNKIRNARVLMSEAMIMHLCEMELLRAMPWEFQGKGTGIILQVHDSLSGEVTSQGHADLQAAGKHWAGVVAECMTRQIPGWGVKFTASGTFGHTLLEA